MHRVPQRIETGGLLLRQWQVSDAQLQDRLITENVDHLRPWMAWIAEEPKPLRRRQELIAGWTEDWEAGGDAVYAVFAAGEIVGSAGLHRRAGPDTLEIGYWIGARFLRRGLATRVASMLTNAALSVSEISRVEIHHDKANIASKGVPQKLAFRLVEERAAGTEAPAELGVECVWRLERSEWEARKSSPIEPRCGACANS